MKKLKAMLSLLLILALVLALAAGCAGQTANETANNSAETTANEASDNTSDAEEEDDSEAPSIVFMMYDLSGSAENAAAAEEQIHDIALREANVDVDIQWVMAGAWQNTVLLAISAGEPMDVIHLSWGGTAASLYASGQLMEIGDLLQEYAPDALSIMADYMPTYTFNGGVYGVPTNRNFCKNGYILMRQDMLDELGLTEKARNMTSFTEFEEILAAIHENMPEVYPFTNPRGVWSDCYVCGTDNFADYDVYDNLGDSLAMIYCRDDKVQIITDLEAFEYECSRTAKWYNNGWCWPDAITDDGSGGGNGLIEQGNGFATALGSEFGAEASYSERYGTPMVAVEFCSGMIKTSQPASIGIGVPVTSEEPEAACRFINLLYTNADVMNLFAWGVEGKDHTVEDGQVKLTGAADAYHGDDFLLGNNLLLMPLYGNGADFYEKVAEINQNAVESEYLGFVFNTEGMDNVITQISAVYDEYRQTLVAGGYTPEYYAAYKEKLETAGIREYQEAFQTQLDAWLANK